jgi:hypothetical protein
MRYKIFMFMIFAIGITSQPLLYHLWINTGTGNPNYLFFVNLVLEVICILCVTEYTKAAMKFRNSINI